MRNWVMAAACAVAFVAAVPAAAAQSHLKTVASKDGALLPVAVDAGKNQILFTLPKPGPDGVAGRFIYATQVRSGLGSTDIRFDRGMNGRTRLLVFRRIGNKVALIYQNPKFRADNASAQVIDGVDTSFAFVTAALADIVKTQPDGSLVIDMAPFLATDVMNVSQMLNSGEAGGFPAGTRIASAKGFKLVPGASMAEPESVKVFPDNIDTDTLLTFEGTSPGPEIARISPDPRRVSFIIHNSFIKLPDPGFETRKFDIRAGTFSTQVFDFNAPLGANMVTQMANHFRLEKIHPDQERSRVKKPIIFYIDNAAPEPEREALKEGVSWWSQAFDAAGLIDAFQVKILPKDADPMDVRYNMVFWANRLTRSWSYGQEVVDPRTGEIVRGAVVLGGGRVRQDINIFEGLVGTKDENTGGPNDPVRAALARLRQLGAHEVGHAIGYVHNFASSTQDRASVMDYPGPLVKIADGKLDLSDAYAVGIGDWDKFMVSWLYGKAPAGADPDTYARQKVEKMIASGARNITDIDSRADDSPTPLASMWDNGADPVAELSHIMQVRAIALSHFGPSVLHAGEPMADLRRIFVPIWLFHRYQVVAAAKSIGGMDYAYKVVGDDLPSPHPVANAKQEAALDGVLATLSAKALTVPAAMVDMLSNGIQGADNPQDDNEEFVSAGASAFDPLVATDVAAKLALSPLLEPMRLNRVYAQHAGDPALLGVGELLDKLIAATIDARKDATGRRIAYRVLLMLAGAARDPHTAAGAAALIDDRLDGLAASLAEASGSNGDDNAWAHRMARMLRSDKALSDELAKAAPRSPAVPMGMPIGGAESDWMGPF